MQKDILGSEVIMGLPEKVGEADEKVYIVYVLQKAKQEPANSKDNGPRAVKQLGPNPCAILAKNRRSYDCC